MPIAVGHALLYFSFRYVCQRTVKALNCVQYSVVYPLASSTLSEKHMIQFRTTAHSGLVAALLAGLALSACNQTPMPSVMAAPPASPAVANISVLSAKLSGASEVPPVTSNGIGTVDGTFNARTALLAWTVTYSGMSGNVTAAHFHGPAIAGVNAGVAVPVTGSTANPIKGEAMLTGAQAADLTAGKWYFNLHTAANPNGEIRGQVTVNPITVRAQ